MSERTPEFIIILGPSGAGKSTISARVSDTPFFDRDKALQKLSGGQSRGFSQEVQQLAANDQKDFIARHLEAKTNYGLQRTFHLPSHLSVIDEPRACGFKITAYFVCAGDAETHVQRASQRLKEGGHDVPANEVKTIYTTSLRNMPRLFEAASEGRIDNVYLIDNSSPKSPRRTLSMEDGEVLNIADRMPEWAHAALAHTPFHIENLRIAQSQGIPISQLDIHGQDRRASLAKEIRVTDALATSDGAIYRTRSALLDDLMYTRAQLVRGVTPDMLSKDFHTFRRTLNSGTARYVNDLIQSVEEQIGDTSRFRDVSAF
jgi:predicted ABC-type ATPase